MKFTKKNLKKIVNEMCYTNCAYAKGEKLYLLDPDSEVFATDLDCGVHPSNLGRGFFKECEEFKKFDIEQKNIILVTTGVFDKWFLDKSFIQKLNSIDHMEISVPDDYMKNNLIEVVDPKTFEHNDEKLTDVQNVINQKCPGKIVFITETQFDEYYNNSIKNWEE